MTSNSFSTNGVTYSYSCCYSVHDFVELGLISVWGRTLSLTWQGVVTSQWLQSCARMRTKEKSPSSRLSFMRSCSLGLVLCPDPALQPGPYMPTRHRTWEQSRTPDRCRVSSYDRWRTSTLRRAARPRTPPRSVTIDQLRFPPQEGTSWGHSGVSPFLLYGVKDTAISSGTSRTSKRTCSRFPLIRDRGDLAKDLLDTGVSSARALRECCQNF